jgi:hypothetical protein
MLWQRQVVAVVMPDCSGSLISQNLSPEIAFLRHDGMKAYPTIAFSTCFRAGLFGFNVSYTKVIGRRQLRVCRGQSTRGRPLSQASMCACIWPCYFNLVEIINYSQEDFQC